LAETSPAQRQRRLLVMMHPPIACEHSTLAQASYHHHYCSKRTAQCAGRDMASSGKLGGSTASSLDTTAPQDHARDIHPTHARDRRWIEPEEPTIPGFPRDQRNRRPACQARQISILVEIERPCETEPDRARPKEPAGASTQKQPCTYKLTA
jgi:hypothetical protein